MVMVHLKLIVFADTEIQVIAITLCDEALYQSLCIICLNRVE